jgi:hypothetical protein
MITDKETVFILGAGASCPYGFPTAYELTKFIFKNYANLIQRLRRNDMFLEQWEGNLSLQDCFGKK